MNDLLSISNVKPVVAGKEQKGKLFAIENLLGALHEWGIDYCHWKSNEHLAASMTGDTDLDILFDKNQKVSLESLLRSLGFKKFTAIAQKQYRDIEDFLGLDFTSGKVIHLHAHYRLTLGERYLKSYQLELEKSILKSRVFDQEFGIYRILPAYELILLCFREALKIRKREVMKMFIKNQMQYSENILREYKWLKQRCTDQEIFDILKTVFENYLPVYSLVIGEFNRRRLLSLSFLLRKEFRQQRLYSPLEALMLRWYREVSVKIYKKSYLFLKRPVISRRIHPAGGLVVAVIGADGSGKSTVIANLQATFKTKLDVYRIYMGRGDGNISFSRKILQGFSKLMFPGQRNLKLPKSAGVTATPPKGFMHTLYKCFLALMVASEKRKNIKRLQAAKAAGMLVICDRFPQNQVMGYNDGPLLHYLSESHHPLFRAFSKIEAKVYAAAENNPPDVLFKLIADVDIIAARKPNDTSLGMLKEKISGIKKLKFPDNCKVITVDATQPKASVMEIIKRGIWEAYPD